MGGKPSDPPEMDRISAAHWLRPRRVAAAPGGLGGLPHQLRQELPRQGVALATSIDNARQQRRTARTFPGARAVADAPGDDQVAQGALGVVMPRAALASLLVGSK